MQSALYGDRDADDDAATFTMRRTAVMLEWRMWLDIKFRCQ